ncbi:Flp family type IVb pilin [Nakamurella endophytica]|uniref:Flp family type IVb pilin n=1 Tax=Nakamurella endophytica TaxID=1748367 RepID=A0A917SM49_9ACTN|nr:Flp family type IVb pilin [Nakamurella endophytica]GGL88882.1 hypothetical protein GCM10011594_05680 [Nakamurella endophytica]
MNALYATLYSFAVTTKDRLRREERGATAVEYGLLVGLIAVVIIAAVLLLGPKLSGIFTSVNDKLPGGSGATSGATPTS